MLEYKGYKGQIDFDDERGLIHGRVINIYDIVNFQGQSVDEVKTAFVDSIEDYLEMCEQLEEEPNKPFSGKFLVRTDPEIHKKIFYAARAAGTSLNAWVNGVLKSQVSKS